MRHAAQAYSKVAKAAPLAPRELEATLLFKAARQLKAVRDGWPESEPRLDEALRYNRQLWTILTTSATDPATELPVALSQNVANLGLFVLNRTIELISNPVPEKLDAMIAINVSLAEGLREAVGSSDH